MVQHATSQAPSTDADIPARPARTDRRPLIAIIGAGPAGLAAAETAAAGGADVTVFDRMPSPGRKFLLAGRGGLNLTHGEDFSIFVQRYGPARTALTPALESFPPDALRAWSADLGEPTFIGTSGRVFPKSFKASPLLRAWLRRLAAAGVALRLRHRWTGWSPEGHLAFDTPDGPISLHADAVVLALGGASWPRLGSDGAWTATLAGAGIPVAPLRPSNCGFAVDWSPFIREPFEGTPLKGIALDFAGARARGDAVVTRDGLEGGPIYALSPRLREAIAREGHAVAHIALRPDLDDATLADRLASRPPKQSTATVLRKVLRLPPLAIALLNEARRFSPEATDPLAIVNRLPIRFDAPAPIAEAISTAGGVPFDEMDETAMLKRRPGIFIAGEMLDWEAPTGGYLLQACFATGFAAGRGAVRFVQR